MPVVSLADIERLYAQHGGLAYGEDVTQLEHALQCAALARAADAAPSLIVAALLHDIGHLFEQEADVADAVWDGRHEIHGARALGGLFGPAVCGPIALHVAAKRYLCFRDTASSNALSAASRRSLQLQGGIMDATAAAIFERQSWWREAVMLRRFDDAGKIDQPVALAFADFAPVLRQMLNDPQAV